MGLLAVPGMWSEPIFRVFPCPIRVIHLSQKSFGGAPANPYVVPKLNDVLPEWTVPDPPFRIKDENIQTSIKVTPQYLIHSFRLPVPASHGR